MMTRSAWVGLAIGIAVLAGGYWYVFMPKDEPVAVVSPSTALVEDVVEVPEQAMQDAPIQHPMPEPVADATPTPPLEESDGSAMQTLRELFGAEPVESFLLPREFIHRLVLLVDSLDREALPLWLRPVRRVAGSFQANTLTLAGEERGQRIEIATTNVARYEPSVAMLERVDATRLAAAYQRYYPLFQDAYDRAGNPRARYFNDRLITIIDHLLATPVVDEPIALVRPKVIYLYADPELQALSSGQKTLLRMGRDNAARVQAKLRQIRSAIVALPTKGTSVP
ncbi:MAG: DUF3014 domain-containing protein [Panacagrimonas sp.]